MVSQDLMDTKHDDGSRFFNRAAALELLASTGACACACTATYPFETIKVRTMLTRAELSAFSVAVRIVKEEGFSTLYAGLGPAVLRAVIQGGVRLALYEQCKKCIPGSSGGNLVLGMGAGAVGALVVAPLDTIRTMQQSIVRTSTNAPRTGALPLVAGLVREGGMASLWMGSSMAVWRCAVLTAVQCGTYDQAKAAAGRLLGTSQTDAGAHVAASLASGVACTSATVPFDNVKTIQIVHRLPTALQGARVVWCEGGGARGFFRGWTSSYLRTAPHTMILFCSLEWIRSAARF